VTIIDRSSSFRFESRETHMGLMDQLKSGVRSRDEPLAIRRLDGSTKESLRTSIRMMPYEECGWITLREAAILFSPEDDEYAFRQIDGGTRNLAVFAGEESHRCRFAFVEGQLYFTRTSSIWSEKRPPLDQQAVQKDLPPWSEGIRWMINQVPSNWSTFLQRAKSMTLALPEFNRCGDILLTLKYQFSNNDSMRNVANLSVGKADGAVPMDETYRRAPGLGRFLDLGIRCLGTVWDWGPSGRSTTFSASSPDIVRPLSCGGTKAIGSPPSS
jgi:hypothetical protein